jgi:hypothetical protein
MTCPTVALPGMRTSTGACSIGPVSTTCTSPPPSGCLPQVRPSPGPRPEPSRCFSETTLEAVTAAVKEWEEGLHSQDTSGYRQVQPSLLAVPLEHR